MKQFFTLLLLNSLLFSTVPLALAEDGTDETEDSDEVLVEGESCEDDSGFVFDVVGEGLVCVEIGTAVPDTDCVLTEDMGCEAIGDSDDDEDSENEVEEEDDNDDDEDEDSVNEVEEDEDEDEDGDGEDDLSDEVETVVEETVEEVFTEEEGATVDDGQEGETVVVETVDEDDLSDEVVEALEEATASGDYPDSFYLSVQWGYFPSDDEDRPELESTTWDGSINFGTDGGESVVARPYKLLRFEPEADSIDFDATTATQTVFSSEILNRTDGILFKVKADLSDREGTKVWMDTEYEDTQAAAYLQDLYNDGGAEFTIGEYKVVMQVLSREDWIQAQSDNKGSGTRPSDAQEGAWYESFMNSSMQNGLFNGLKDDKGHLTGQMGPERSLTRFEMLKVLFKLANKINADTSLAACDAETVSETDETDWMGDHWARGYVQCVVNAGVDLTLFNDVIGSSVEEGEKAALRWEVLVTAAELLDLDIPERSDSVPTDVAESDLSEDEMNAIGFFYEMEVVTGYSDGTFKPLKTVNRAEMFKIVSLLLESQSI